MVTLNTIKEILEENKNNISIHECAVYNRPFHVIKNDYGCRRVAQEITFHLSLKKEIPTLSGLNCFFSELLTNLNTPLPKVFPFEWNYILKKNRGFDERGNFLPHDKKGLAGFERILVSFNEIIAKVERKVTVEYNFLFNKENKGQFIRFRKKTKTYKTHTPEEENVYDPFDELTRRIWFVTYFNEQHFKKEYSYHPKIKEITSADSFGRHMKELFWKQFELNYAKSLLSGKDWKVFENECIETKAKIPRNQGIIIWSQKDYDNNHKKFLEDTVRKHDYYVGKYL